MLEVKLRNVKLKMTLLLLTMEWMPNFSQREKVMSTAEF